MSKKRKPHKRGKKISTCNTCLKAGSRHGERKGSHHPLKFSYAAQPLVAKSLSFWSLVVNVTTVWKLSSNVRELNEKFSTLKILLGKRVRGDSLWHGGKCLSLVNYIKYLKGLAVLIAWSLPVEGLCDF